MTDREGAMEKRAVRLNPGRALLCSLCYSSEHCLLFLRERFMDQDQEHWIGFDLGGTKMLGVVLNSELQAVGKKRKKTRGYEGAESGVSRIIQTVRQALNDAKVSPKQLAGIGIGCPGPIDLAQGVVLDAVNLSWQNVPLKALLEEEFQCPVSVLNDVDSGVYGEYCFGAAKDCRSALGVFPGTGIGGGCVYNGQIVHGGTFSCFEIGHVQVTREGKKCGCGLRGCLETEASRLTIAAEVAKAAYRGEAPHIMETVGTTVADIRSGVLAEAVKAGDVVVEQIIRRAANFIGIAVANAINLLGPDVIILGGGLVEAMPEIFVESVEASAKANVLPSFANEFKTVAAELGDDACVLGAAAWAREQAQGRS